MIITRTQAVKIRKIIEMAVQSLDDKTALQEEAKILHPSWESCVELGTVTAESGFRFRYGEDLYRCVNPNPTFQANWIPGEGTEALYVRIDETHAGTADDPIPYDGNMELVEGSYYSQDGVTYRCTRSTGTAVYNALKDLVGIYVELGESA